MLSTLLAQGLEASASGHVPGGTFRMKVLTGEEQLVASNKRRLTLADQKGFGVP